MRNRRPSSSSDEVSADVNVRSGMPTADSCRSPFGQLWSFDSARPSVREGPTPAVSGGQTRYLRSGCLPDLGIRGSNRPLSDPSTDFQVPRHDSERDGRDVPVADMLAASLPLQSGFRNAPLHLISTRPTSITTCPVALAGAPKSNSSFVFGSRSSTMASGTCVPARAPIAK